MAQKPCCHQSTPRVENTMNVRLETGRFKSGDFVISQKPTSRTFVREPTEIIIFPKKQLPLN
jgi:hypothetical protein